MGLPMILARRRIRDDEWGFSLGITSGANIEVKDIHPTTGGSSTWWLDSPTAGESLMARLKVVLDSHANAAVFTSTFNPDTGKVTIASDGATFSITWISTALRDWLGHTGNLAGANTYTSTNPCQGVVFAGSVGKASFDEEWKLETTVSEAVAEAGPPAGIGSGNFRPKAEFSWEWEPPSLTTSPRLASGIRDLLGTQVPWTIQDLWQHCLTFHGPIRYYDDRSAGLGTYENGWDLYLSAMSDFLGSRKISGVATHYRFLMHVRRYLQAG